MRERIRWNVTTDCEKIGNEVYSYATRWLARRPVDGLYVHPETGILMYAEREGYGNWQMPRPWEKEINYIALDDGHVLIKDEHGDWYEHWSTIEKVGYRNTELVEGKYVPVGPVRYNDREVKHKRELNHKEVKQVKENLLRHGTNKDLLARLNGKYIPAYKW